ncbi:cupin 2 conserved barrel domain protein [alpha proteobacterium U9-1i]|nr:cupin 2 conserved barrel domain protein [alpha proteobacterium U9-1i]
MSDTKKALWRAGEIAPTMRPFTQQLNPNSLFRAAALSRLAGMSRAHVSLVRLPPGKDSFAYHAHMHEEEWIYIVSGRAMAEIDGRSVEVGPGDFMGFATPSVPHLLRNTFDEECTYLMGGEDKPIEVVTYPNLDKRYLLMQTPGGTEFYELGEPTKPFRKAD